MDKSLVDLLISNLNNTDDDIRALRIEITELRKEIIRLYMFKWKLTGIITTISVLASLVVSVYFK